MPTSTHPGSHKFCLYLLVCKAEAGPLAGLFKLGISDRLARRHDEHGRHWEEFDLARSVVVWAENRREVQHLETTLRHAYGAPELEARARAEGRMLSNEELIAAGSCRRHPGRCAGGYTEFYTVACFEDAVATLAHLVERRRGCKAGMHLQRGITLADLERDWGAAGDLPPGRARGPGSIKLREALQDQEQAELDERVEAKLEEVLAFALAHESELRWVDLGWWHELRAMGRVGRSSRQGLVDLYFGPFDSVRAGPSAWSAGRSAAQVRFEESFARLDPAAAPLAPRQWRWKRPRQVCSLRAAPFNLDRGLPHPACAGTLCLRVEPELSDLGHPLFERFTALARRVEGGLAREQMVFC